MSRLASLLLLCLPGLAAAAPGYRDGTPTAPQALCGATNSYVPGIQTRVGYVVDPVAEIPQVGQVTYVHAVATNKNCVGDAASLDFFLPPGATLAISSQYPVNCFLGNGSISGPIGQPIVVRVYSMEIAPSSLISRNRPASLFTASVS